MGQLAGQRGSFRAGQRGAADGAAGRARSKLDSHLPQPTALSPARLLRCTATWLRKKKPLPSKTHSKNGGWLLVDLVAFVVSRSIHSGRLASTPCVGAAVPLLAPRRRAVWHVCAAWRAGLLGMPLRAPRRVECRGCRQGKAQACCPTGARKTGGSGGEGDTRGAAERLGRADHHRRPEDAGGGHGG